MQASFYNNTINMNTTSFTLWTDSYVWPTALGVYKNGAYSGVSWYNNTVNVIGQPNQATNVKLQCISTQKPACVQV